MNRHLLVPLVTFGILLGGAVPAPAQYPGSLYGQYYNPYSQQPGTNPGGAPRLSPYLNLLRNNNPAVNYYLGVVPEIDRRRFQRQTTSAITGLEQRLATPVLNPEDTDLAVAVSVTGHPAVFMNTATYFGGAGAVPLAPRAVPMSPLPPARPAAGRPR
jgi:hypothetical protein